MDSIRIYSISDRYIAYLRSDLELTNVCYNKEEIRRHTRKYLGTVLKYCDFNYFIPFSSPKNTDYLIGANGVKTIRKSIIPIIRIVTTDTISGLPELKGTLKLSNMIPVPESELIPYDIDAEQDRSYRDVVRKQWAFIRKNKTLIMRNASIIYKQKTGQVQFHGKPTSGYLASTVDFKYAESKCTEFVKLYPIAE